MFARHLLFFALMLGLNSCAARSPSAPPADLPTNAELQRIVAPFALYPDPLLQRILTAATLPDQIIDAAVFIEHGGAPMEIPNQSWERSVQFVANYPLVLAQLADDIDSTIALGAAFTESPEEVRECIQAYRRNARAHGNIKSTAYQTIIEEGAPGPTSTIRIEPTDPNIMYVPANNTVIYERHIEEPQSLCAPLASFGLGVAHATALDIDDTYYYGGPFYGPGFWYGGPIYRRWYDYRRDRWHHAYDYGRRHRDSAHHHDEWLSHRHDLGRRHTAWREKKRIHTGGHRIGPESPDGRASFRPTHPPSGTSRARPQTSPRASNHRGSSHDRGTTGRFNRPSHGGHRPSPAGSHGLSRGGRSGRGR